MAVYEYGVMANKPPILKIITGTIAGTTADTLSFPTAMTRLVVKNTGTAALTFSVNGNPDLTDTLEVGETIDESFSEFDHVVVSGTVGTGYKVMVG